MLAFERSCAFGVQRKAIISSVQYLDTESTGYNFSLSACGRVPWKHILSDGRRVAGLTQEAYAPGLAVAF